MIGVVLAAGSGSRMRPLTDRCPKTLLEVGGRPIIEWGLETLTALRPERVVIVVGRAREPIAAAVGDCFEGVPVCYAVQPAPTGSADALLAAQHFLDGRHALAVMNGDNVFAADLAPAVREHEAERRDATLLVERTSPERAEQGICRVDAEGRVRGIIEHPDASERSSGVVSAGFYLFECSPILDACRRVRVSPNGERELPEAINLMIRRGQAVGSFWLDGERVNVNRPEDLERAARLLARGPERPKRP